MMKHREQRTLGEFELVGDSENGYSVEAVDEYFEELAASYSRLRLGQVENAISSADIRMVTFPAEKGGYLPVEVDAALDRVEDRFAGFERRYKRQQLGRSVWDEEVELLAEVIMGRLNRPEGERFRRPSKRLVKGYYRRDVDALCERLRQHLKNDDSFDPQLIRSARFRSATGDMCYEETQVDVFMDRCIELMLELQ